MSVFKRDNSWWIDFTTPNGERIRHSARTADRQLAEEYHDRLKTRYWEIQRLGVKPERSWQEAVIRWIKETDHKADHHNDVAKLRWLDQHLGHLNLSQINRETIDKVAAIKRKDASASTANHYLALIRAILRRARDDWEWIDHVPKVRLFPITDRRVRWITQDEASRLLFELPTHLRDMAAFTLATGLRQSNVSYLRWDQVDMQRCTAWIHHDQAKARRAIAVPLNADALSVLKRRHGQHDEWVFTYNGKPVERCSTKAWYAALERAGIENFRWHDLRHTWASWHVQAGTSMQELMELGSWRSFEMVHRYAHLASDHLLAAASRINGTNVARPRLVSGL
jgi:integrase